MNTNAANAARSRAARIRTRARGVLRASGMSDAEIAVAMRVSEAAVRRARIRDDGDPWNEVEAAADARLVSRTFPPPARAESE